MHQNRIQTETYHEPFLALQLARSWFSSGRLGCHSWGTGFGRLEGLGAHVGRRFEGLRARAQRWVLVRLHVVSDLL